MSMSRASLSLRAAPALLAFVALMLSSTGCAILNFGEVGHEGGDATLGQAAAMAADTSKAGASKKERPLDVGYTTPPETEVSAGIEGSSYAEPVAPGPPVQKAPPDPFQRPVFGLFMSLGSFGGDSYDGYGNAGLSIGGYAQERLRLDLFARAGGVDFKGQSLQGQAFENTVDLQIELMARYELTKGWTFLSLYPVAGFGTGTMFWDYASPVPVTEDGVVRYVKDDHINHFYGYLGVGFAALRMRHMLLDVIVTGGGRLYDTKTYNGFSNDLLPDVGFAQVQFGLAFR
jgi:hypothetical protein